mmetsp:Transcript_24816/g.62532  ORF Transcript_24816/g.62532 Transcript_24816/m.62532 type:complete len:244 (-) Transcript_24816:768-1499(-)
MDRGRRLQTTHMEESARRNQPVKKGSMRHRPLHQGSPHRPSRGGPSLAGRRDMRKRLSCARSHRSRYEKTDAPPPPPPSSLLPLLVSGGGSGMLCIVRTASMEEENCARRLMSAMISLRSSTSSPVPPAPMQSSTENRILKAAATPSMRSLAHILHLSQPTQSITAVTLCSCRRSSSFFSSLSWPRHMRPSSKGIGHAACRSWLFTRRRTSCCVMRSSCSLSVSKSSFSSSGPAFMTARSVKR